MLGVDLGALPPQFEGMVAGRTLILDGDGPAYVAAATVKRLDTAIRRFQETVLTQMFLTRSQSARIHLTASDSMKAGRGRILAAKPYQGNRKGKAKPALLEPLREAMALRENWLPEFEHVTMHRLLEADDGMMQDAYRLGDACVVSSEDKDLRMTAAPYWCEKSGRVLPGEPVGFVGIDYTEVAKTAKLVGQGPMFFWGQMLCGDTADNVRGIERYRGQLCGVVGAYEALGNVKCIHEAANTVLDAYREIDQNPLAEGWLLWLLRWPGDSFWNYLQELELTQKNKAFVQQCAGRRWFLRPGEQHAA